MQSRQELEARIEAGERMKYLFFWSQRPRRPGTIDHSCFSQWYPAEFEVEGIPYATAEHYMMAEKARLFGDTLAEQQIRNASHPGEAKRLGRMVAGFEESTWEQERFAIVVRGNRAKFTQHKPLGTYLLQTGSRVLVEASPRDAVWGIGLAADDPAAAQPHLWRGENLLGFALMSVRAQLQGNA